MDNNAESMSQRFNSLTAEEQQDLASTFLKQRDITMFSMWFEKQMENKMQLIAADTRKAVNTSAYSL